MTTLHTTRLRLEPYAEHHLDGIHEMNSRPEVMQFITGQPQTRDQTAAGIAFVQRAWAVLGASWWAFVALSDGRIAGAGCIQYIRREEAAPAELEQLRINPLEIGWRLHPDFWHQGLASEAAARMSRFAFESLAAAELLAVRDPQNVRSARVMDRLGMRYRGLEHWYGTTLATHVLTREDWQSAHQASGEA